MHTEIHSSNFKLNYIVLENTLPAELLEKVRRAAALGPFDSGKETSFGLAKDVKNNLQLSNLAHGALLDEVGRALVSHPVVRAYALPKLIGRPILNRYEQGMGYGMHSDGAYISDVRTDIAFTLFLEDPSDYDGGELVIATPAQQFTFKLPVGCMVVYPCGYMHAVNPVTRGVRQAVVGWIQSRVRDLEQRTIVAKLNAVSNSLQQDSKYLPLTLQTVECTQNLIRMWGE